MKVRSYNKRFLARILNAVLFACTWPFRLVGYPEKVALEKPRSFLICRLDHIGDAILSTPIFHSLKEKFPEATITVLCGSWSREIFDNNPYIDSVMVIDCPWWVSIRNHAKRGSPFLKEVWNVMKEIRRLEFDVFVDLRGDIRHIFLLGWLVGIPVRISYTRSGGGFLLTHPRVYEHHKHEVERNYGLLEVFEPLNKYFTLEVHTGDTVKLSLRKKLSGLVRVDDEEYIVLFNGGRSRLRRLSMDKFKDLCERLVDEYRVKCCIVGGTEDFDEMENLRVSTADRIGRIINLCGRLSLAELKELINSALIYVGTDSSVTHLSAASNTPSVALFGPLDPQQARPIGKGKTEIYHRYPCSPCLQDICVVTGSTTRGQCMDDITVDEIVHRVSALLE